MRRSIAHLELGVKNDERFVLSAAPPVVEVQNLSRHFGSKLALSGVSLIVPRGGVLD